MTMSRVYHFAQVFVSDLFCYAVGEVLGETTVYCKSEAMEAESKLPAVKMFICMLGRATKPRGAAESLDICETGLVLFGLEFARVWIQGTIVDWDTENGCFVVDDGTATLTVMAPHAEGEGVVLPQRGAYVLLVGAVTACDGHERSSSRRYRMLCDVMKDVGSESFNREELWCLEVIDYWKSRERHLHREQK